MNQDEYKNKMNLIGWSMVTSPKWEGGLSVRDSRVARKIMCVKRLISLLDNHDLLWVRIFRAKNANFVS